MVTMRHIVQLVLVLLLFIDAFGVQYQWHERLLKVLFVVLLYLIYDSIKNKRYKILIVFIGMLVLFQPFVDSFVKRSLLMKLEVFCGLFLLIESMRAIKFKRGSDQ